MQKKLILVIGLILLYSQINFAQSNQIKKLDGSNIASSEVDKIITYLMDTAKVDGVSLSIFNDNKPVYIKTYGYKNKELKELLDTSSVLYAASYSKAVFAFLTLKLVEEGILDLDKPLYQYLDKPLPEYEYYKDLASDERWKLITARMCLSNTTGLPNTRWVNSRTLKVDTTGKLEIYFEPGTKYAYSGEGFKLLQLVEEKITGKNIDELAIERIFKPFGMTRTGFIWHARFDDNFAIGHDENGKLMHKRKRTVPIANGSMVTTIADYSRFIQHVMQGKGLNNTLNKQMLLPQIEIFSKYQFPTITSETTTANKSIQLSYGLGWGLFTCKYGRAFFKEGHDDAWRHYNVNFPDKKISIIIMCNSANGESIFKELLEKVIGDTCTPWQWENYIPYNYKAN